MKLSYGLFALIGLSEAGKRKPVRAVTTTTSTTTATTTTTASMATNTTPVVPDAGSFAEDIAGEWNTSGNNVNVMLNAGSPITGATVVITNNDGSLVMSVDQAVIDEAAGTITINGNVGSIAADGSVTFADGTVWGAGTAVLTTTTGTTVVPGATTADPGAGAGATDAYGNPVDDGSASSDSPYGGGMDTEDPYSGGSSGGSDPYNPSGGGYISGDPHVMVQTPGQKAICYDIHGDALDYVSLLFDVNTGLEINGKLNHVKEHKSRLSSIGFKTPAGVEIGIFPETVTVGYKGQIEEQYDYSDYMRVTTDDATIEILSKNDAKHQGVMIELNDGSLFHVADKDFKESMKLEIIRSDGLSGRMSGVLGQTIQPKDYVINPDGSIMVENRYIPTSTWDGSNDCFRIRDFDVREFLGHSIYDYAVSGIFSTMDQAWLQVQLQSEADPK